jgi:hypothetical protein
MVRTRRNGKQCWRRTQRAGRKPQAGGDNTGIDYLLFGNKTQGHNPLAISQARDGTTVANAQGAIKSLRRQVKERYAKHTAEQLGKVVEETKTQVASTLKDVKTMPGLMNEVTKRLDSLISELNENSECLSENVKRLLTQLIFILSSDTVISSLDAELNDKAAEAAAEPSKKKAVEDEVPAKPVGEQKQAGTAFLSPTADSIEE